MKFCGQCAAPLATICPSCGAANPPGNKFCGQCAAVLSGPAEPRFASPDAYLPKHLAEKILTSKSALEGERKQVTVLFADLKGSMELLAGRDPEEARTILDQVLERLMDAVHRYEGMVNQVMGDGIMALFGAPLAHEDHAVRACYSALRMQEAIRHYSDELRRSQGAEVQIRVGLNSGEVVVRAIGSDLRMDYTAVGETPHLAARIEQLALPGSIRLTAETARLAEGFVEVKPLGPIPVKGLAAPVEILELTGGGRARRRFEAAAARGLTRFVGRQTELAVLAQALERTRAGHGQIVASVGEAGVGKSRLFWEFTHSHRTAGCLVLESGSVSYGKATPYLPVIDLLKAYFQIEAQDDHRRIREKVSGKLMTLDPSLIPTIPVVLGLLDVPVDDPQWEALDNPQRRQHTLTGVKRLLLREAQVQPLVVVFEDLHWIDAETQAVLDGLVESLPTVRSLLLVNYRPEYQHGWGTRSYYTQLQLDPLPPESAEELLETLLGADPAVEPLKRLLIERTEGNPFFLEESVRALLESKVLLGERGSYRLARPVEAIQVPATVQAVLAARIDRFPAEEKHLLQSAAVVGKDVPYAILRAIADVPEAALQVQLKRLQAAEFIYETRLVPDLEYTFKHALTHEVAYGSLLQARRKALHARVLEAIEHLSAHRLPEQTEALARHAMRGEVWDKALLYSRQTGAKAFARAAREAETHFREALEALEHLPETRERLEQAVDIRLDLRTALVWLGELRRAGEPLREAERLARSLGDQPRLGRASAFFCASFYFAGDFDRAIEYGQRAHAIARDLGSSMITVFANRYLGEVYRARGDYPQAIDAYRNNLDIAQREPLQDLSGLSNLVIPFSRTGLASCLAETGNFVEAAERAEDALRQADAMNHPLMLANAHSTIGDIAHAKGDFRQAIVSLERALGIGRAADVRLLLPAILATLCSAYALSGRARDALALAEELKQRDAARGEGGTYSLRLARLGGIYLRAGRREEALQCAQRALDLAKETGARPAQAWALRLIGEIGSGSEPPDVEEAGHAYAEAVTLAGSLGMRPLVAHCHLGLGKLYRRAGRHPTAGESLATAATLYREMDMRFWLSEAEAAAAQPAN
jgi:class 3 adenylate cyclase/tetratricopeptide (TPR) repeat protein